MVAILRKIWNWQFKNWLNMYDRQAGTKACDLAPGGYYFEDNSGMISLSCVSVCR